MTRTQRECIRKAPPYPSKAFASDGSRHFTTAIWTSCNRVPLGPTLSIAGHLKRLQPEIKFQNSGATDRSHFPYWDTRFDSHIRKPCIRMT
jgi:hypothetical protein